MKKIERTSCLCAEISDILGLTATARKVLGLLMRTKRGLRVSEVIARTKRSERSIRMQLRTLSKLKLIKRSAAVTKKGRITYRYFAPRVSDLVKSVNEETLRRLRALEGYVK